MYVIVMRDFVTNVPNYFYVAGSTNDYVNNLGL